MRLIIVSRLVFVFCITGLCLSPLSSKAEQKHGFIGRTLSIEEVSTRWGKKPFSSSEFKKGDRKLRASMVADLIQSGSLIGKKRLQILTELGLADGSFFLDDFIPAYIVEDLSSDGGPTWQIVFLLSPDEKVERVVLQARGSEVDELVDSSKDVDVELERASEELKKNRKKK